MTPSLDALRAAGRDGRGRFAAGHLVNARHLLHVADDHPALTAEHAARVDAVAADLGGMSGLSATQAPLVREVARLQIITESLGADLLARGVLTGKGRTRAALSAYVMVLDRLERLSVRLGLERKPRAVGVHAIAADVRGDL